MRVHRTTWKVTNKRFINWNSGPWWCLLLFLVQCTSHETDQIRERISINDDWKFFSKTSKLGGGYGEVENRNWVMEENKEMSFE